MFAPCGVQGIAGRVAFTGPFFKFNYDGARLGAQVVRPGYCGNLLWPWDRFTFGGGDDALGVTIGKQCEEAFVLFFRWYGREEEKTKAEMVDIGYAQE